MTEHYCNHRTGFCNRSLQNLLLKKVGKLPTTCCSKDGMDNEYTVGLSLTCSSLVTKAVHLLPGTLLAPIGIYLIRQTVYLFLNAVYLLVCFHHRQVTCSLMQFAGLHTQLSCSHRKFTCSHRQFACSHWPFSSVTDSLLTPTSGLFASSGR
jgi:hypothetical protein